MWLNDKKQDIDKAIANSSLTIDDINEAEARLKRFANYFQVAFPATKATYGIIESPLIEINQMKKNLQTCTNHKIKGKLMLKCDSHLPISGSIKARGGIYEVIKHAEDIAIKEGLLKYNDDYAILNEKRFYNLFSKYSIAVGSTGNLGLSIGIISAKLGFNVTVHMSADVKEWKKDLLRSKGVTVVEYASDYSEAVKVGRKLAKNDPTCYFVDDENSTTLFLGYAVAAKRLKKQLEANKITVNQEHPLFVYLPCGVGGAPGGITFGLKQFFKDAVHCFFVEPTHSPSMLLGLMTGYHDQICVQDFNIDNLTVADGLAVGRPSKFVGKTIEPLISGVYTITDKHMYHLLTKLVDNENLYLEPSALAGIAGPAIIEATAKGKQYLKQENLMDLMNNATHIVWATGGSMVPEDIMKEYYIKGKNI